MPRRWRQGGRGGRLPKVNQSEAAAERRYIISKQSVPAAAGRYTMAAPLPDEISLKRYYSTSRTCP